MATATDLLFQGGDDTRRDARLQRHQWRAGLGVSGPARHFNQSPITYLGPDGRQYMAIILGRRAANAAVDVDAAPDDAARYRRSGSTLYVFALPETVAAH